MINFKNFLINESKTILGNKVGDILSAVNELEDDFDNMSPRHLIRVAESIVNQIRRILHNQWNSDNFKHLHKLQAIGVAIMKTIDEKGDVKQVLRQTGEELSRLTKILGVKINHIEVPEKVSHDEDSPDMELTDDQDRSPKKKKKLSMDDLKSDGGTDEMMPPSNPQGSVYSS